MNNLYTLNQQWQEVANMLYQDDIDEQMVLDTLESIEGDIEDKADNYAKIIKDLENKRNARKEEAKRLTENARIFENRILRLKQNLFNTMKQTGKTNFTTNLFTFRIQKNGGKRALIIDGEVPKEYTKTIIENDSDKIREDLESGKELTFAHLESQGESLRIK